MKLHISNIKETDVTFQFQLVVRADDDRLTIGGATIELVKPFDKALCKAKIEEAIVTMRAAMCLEACIAELGLEMEREA